ncbi:MAG: YggS family pyridoxal phosphate-dependent enzyme [Rhizobiales bacterium]|nr:YggS family pyridoxal phosphate-dependent enzyme [Hyphomicrobiales bacterium]
MLRSAMKRNLAAINERIARACDKANRDPQSVTLVGVSKTVGREAVDAAYEAGLRHFGENRVQDAIQKFAEPMPSDAVLHMIGQLQSNKASQALKLFHVFESVDRPSIIAELDRQAAKLERDVPVLLEVNVAGEAQKAGCQQADAATLAKQVVASQRLQLMGLMTIAPLVNDPEAVRSIFAGLRTLRDCLVQSGLAPELPVLSMGMTNDFEIAIEEGATEVRVGRALFTL